METYVLVLTSQPNKSQSISPTFSDQTGSEILLKRGEGTEKKRCPFVSEFYIMTSCRFHQAKKI